MLKYEKATARWRGWSRQSRQKERDVCKATKKTLQGLQGTALLWGGRAVKRETGREGPRVAPGLLTSNPRSQPLCTAFALRRGGSHHLSSVPYFTCDPSPTAAAPHLPSGLASVAGPTLSPFTRLWVCEGPAARSPGARAMPAPEAPPGPTTQ